MAEENDTSDEVISFWIGITVLLLLIIFGSSYAGVIGGVVGALAGLLVCGIGMTMIPLQYFFPIIAAVIGLFWILYELGNF